MHKKSKNLQIKCCWRGDVMCLQFIRKQIKTIQRIHQFFPSINVKQGDYISFNL